MLELPLIADGEDKSSPFKNCIRKNYRHIRKWAKRTETNCFRVYDRQMHHYPLAIDFYAGRFCVHYFAKSKEEEVPSQGFVDEVNGVLIDLFQTNEEMIFWRTRKRSKETRQYEKFGASKDFFVAYEYGLKFQINLVDYLDTGLFLDHRETRRLVAAHSAGKRVLNLFAYTCSFSVHAAAAGAVFTKNVDMSNTYTAWGKRNFELNNLPLKNNAVEREDCLKFLDHEIRAGVKYDVIVIDPPTISRSKKMEGLFDIHVDYVDLIKKGLRLLVEGGVIFFSTNSRRFQFDESQFKGCKIIDITDKTLPIDFHDKRIHRCWKINKDF